MNNIFEKIKKVFKTYKKRILISISIGLLAFIIVAGIIGGVVHSKANANMKYSQDKLQQIALGKVPGEVIEVDKKLNFREAVYEYKFKIKDKENMLQTVKVDSKNGVILKVNNEKSMKENKEGHREHKEHRDRK